MSQNLSIDETLKYIANNSSTYFNVDSEGFIYNDRYKFHASEVSASTHMNTAVKIICTPIHVPGPIGGVTDQKICIQCLKRDCYTNGSSRSPSTNEIYINVDSSYDQNRLYNAINHLIKKVAEKYPRRSNNDPFAK